MKIKQLCAAILSLLSISITLSSCATQSEIDDYDSREISERREKYQRYLKQGDFKILYLTSDELVYEPKPYNSRIMQRAVDLNEQESEAINECLKALAARELPEPCVPCGWPLEYAYWILSHGERVLYIGPNGENHILSFPEQIVWRRTREAMADAIKRAQKKARSSAGATRINTGLK